jgi:hypothetical protein
MAKPELSIIFGPKKPGAMGGMGGEDHASEVPPEFSDCADRAFDALKKGDREGFASALYDACEAHANPGSDESEDQPEELDEEA